MRRPVWLSSKLLQAFFAFLLVLGRTLEAQQSGQQVPLAKGIADVQERIKNNTKLIDDMNATVQEHLLRFGEIIYTVYGQENDPAKKLLDLKAAYDAVHSAVVNGVTGQVNAAIGQLGQVLLDCGSDPGCLGPYATSVKNINALQQALWEGARLKETLNELTDLQAEVAQDTKILQNLIQKSADMSARQSDGGAVDPSDSDEPSIHPPVPVTLPDNPTLDRLLSDNDPQNTLPPPPPVALQPPENPRADNHTGPQGSSGSNAGSSASDGWCNGDQVICQAWKEGGDGEAFGIPPDSDPVANATYNAAKQSFYNQNPQLMRFEPIAYLSSPSSQVEEAIQNGSLGAGNTDRLPEIPRSPCDGMSSCDGLGLQTTQQSVGVLPQTGASMDAMTQSMLFLNEFGNAVSQTSQQFAKKGNSASTSATGSMNSFLAALGAWENKCRATDYSSVSACMSISSATLAGWIKQNDCVNNANNQMENCIRSFPSQNTLQGGAAPLPTQSQSQQKPKSHAQATLVGAQTGSQSATKKRAALKTLQAVVSKTQPSDPEITSTIGRSPAINRAAPMSAIKANNPEPKLTTAEPIKPVETKRTNIQPSLKSRLGAKPLAGGLQSTTASKAGLGNGSGNPTYMQWTDNPAPMSTQSASTLRTAPVPVTKPIITPRPVPGVRVPLKSYVPPTVSGMGPLRIYVPPPIQMPVHVYVPPPIQIPRIEPPHLQLPQSVYAPMQAPISRPVVPQPMYVPQPTHSVSGYPATPIYTAPGFRPSTHAPTYRATPRPAPLPVPHR
jgi:hypothetical protein